MAIEKCPQCEQEVLDNQYSCPACGYVKSGEPENPEQKNQPGETGITPENTPKRLQIQGALSLIILIIGVFWFFLTADDYQQTGEVNIIALIMFVGGLIAYIVTRFQIWRQHK